GKEKDVFMDKLRDAGAAGIDYLKHFTHHIVKKKN
uniref:U1-poneritoxin-Na2a n=1 Tax=Neoponera apicalis TaxID=2320211 RepID=TX2A_NEOAP|nr:RecName: Full=U1-poneritoxin-Na2a; Short=U1-PONTX-Na2a; AltName: Full=Poneratoxin; AltName: Full=Ponericin Pa IV1 [Neoponera apicalis]